MEQEKRTEKRKMECKRIIQPVVFIGMGIFFIWISLYALDTEEIRMILDSIKLVNNPFSWCMLLLAAVGVVLSDLIRALRVQMLLESLQHRPRLAMVFHSVMVCYLANLAVPRLGEVLRCTFLQRFEGVPFQQSLGTVITERAVDILCWLLLLLAAIGTNATLLNNVIIDQQTNLSLGTLLQQKFTTLLGNYGLYLAVGLTLLAILVAYLTRHRWSEIYIFVKIKDFIVGIGKGFLSIKNMEHPWRFVLLTILLWLTYFLTNYICLKALPFLEGVGGNAAFLILTFSTIAFMVSQGGLGSYPLFVAGILALFNVSYTHGLAAGWVGWLMQTAVILVIGTISLLLASFYRKKIVSAKN